MKTRTLRLTVFKKLSFMTFCVEMSGLIKNKYCKKLIIFLFILPFSFQKISSQVVDLNSFFPKNAPTELWERAILLKSASDSLTANSIQDSAVYFLQKAHFPEAQLMILTRVAGYHMSNLRNFEKAGQILDTAQKLFIENKKDTLSFAYADFYNTKAMLSGMQGNHKGRLTNYQHAYQVLKSYDSTHEAMFFFLRNLMQANFMLRHIKEGFEYFDALRELAAYHNNHYYLTEAFMGAGNITKFYKPELSALFFEHVFNLAEFYNITTILNDPFFYISLGSGYTANNNHHKALEFYKKGLDLLNTSKRSDDNNLRNSFYYYIGVSFKNLKNNEDALVYLDSALIVYKERGENRSQNYYRTLNLYGLTLNNAGRFEEALSVNKDVLQYYLSVYGKNNAYFMQHAFHEVARSYRGLKQYNDAIEHINKAFLIYMDVSDPVDPITIPDIKYLTSADINFQVFEFSIYEKINILLDMFADTKDTTYLTAVFEHFDFVMKAIDLHALAGQTIETIYGISARYKQQTNSLFNFMAEHEIPQPYWKEAYLIGAKSKAYSFLLEELQNKQQDDESLLPSSKKKKELVKQLTSLNNYTHSDIFIATTSERLLIEKEQFLYGLDKPISAEKKLTPRLAETRQMNINEAIRNDELVVDYYVTGKYIHTFFIDDKNFEVRSITRPKNLEAINENFFRGLKTGHATLLEDATLELSELLLKHLNPCHSKSLVLVPDEQLWAVPFEVLIKDGKYLVEKTAVSYRYTSPVFRMSKQTDRPHDYAFLAFAPIFDEESLAYVSNTSFDTELGEEVQGIFRDVNQLAPLPSSAVEVLSINDMFGSKSLTTSVHLRHEAGKEKFLNLADKAHILHIATHGLAHTGQPEQSGLFFTLNPSVSDFLYVGEIADIPLNADLVVLSACKSGYGAILRGEGIMGISKSFMAAGANNVVASLWKVHDEKTNIFMQDFYKYILEGHSYKYALHKVKNDFIKQQELPMDWGGFIIIEK